MTNMYSRLILDKQIEAMNKARRPFSVLIDGREHSLYECAECTIQLPASEMALWGTDPIVMLCLQCVRKNHPKDWEKFVSERAKRKLLS